MRCIPIVAALALATLAQAQPAPRGDLKIVVIAGEDAVNVIQQKTAVAPIVEVRDRNNLPVSGATVTFSIGGQGASFGGAQSITVVTNAAGQATAAGITPTAAGAIQINATATFQGQTAVATISQSNVMTAAQVAGAAAAGGGGISGATIGIIAAVAGGGGAIAATQAGGGDGDGGGSTSTTPGSTGSTAATSPTGTGPSPSPSPSPAPTPQPTSSSLAGDIEGRLSGSGSLWVDGRNVVNCPASYNEAARITLSLVTQPNGEVSGTLTLAGTFTDASGNTCSPMPEPSFPVSFTGPVTGTSGNLRFSHDYRQTGNSFGSAGIQYTLRGSVSITGSVSGGTFSGTMHHNLEVEQRGPNWNSSGALTTATGIAVTLR